MYLLSSVCNNTLVFLGSLNLGHQSLNLIVTKSDFFNHPEHLLPRPLPQLNGIPKTSPSQKCVDVVNMTRRLNAMSQYTLPPERQLFQTRLRRITGYLNKSVNHILLRSSAPAAIILLSSLLPAFACTPRLLHHSPSLHSSFVPP